MRSLRTILELNMRWQLAACFLMTAVIAAAAAPLEPVSREAKAPLMFVRLAGPEGMTVTFYEGPNTGRTLDAPVAVGLRPGHLYRLRITLLQGNNETHLYPSLEVLET